MIELKTVASFNDTFENLNITVSEIVVEKFIALLNSTLPRDTPYTNIWQDTNASSLGDTLDLRGKIHLFLKNQEQNDMTSLFFTIKFRTIALHETDTVSVFTKTVQYFFKWLNKYVKEQNILGQNGEIFIVPDFSYSKSHFESVF